MADKQRLEEIRKRAGAASPGPWDYAACNEGNSISNPIINWDVLDGKREVLVLEGPVGGTISLEQKKANAWFVSCSRTDIPWLIEQVEGLEEKLNLEILKHAALCIDFLGQHQKLKEAREEIERLKMRHQDCGVED